MARKSTIPKTADSPTKMQQRIKDASSALLDTISEEIERLKALRRKLCCYANSDTHPCDCKYIIRTPEGGVQPRRGEHTGCCEAREAIACLQRIASSFKTKMEDEPRYGRCHMCKAPFHDPSAERLWKYPSTEDPRGYRVMQLCCTCSDKMIAGLMKGKTVD